ncbi:Transmembrane receptor, eukaryota [Artemisia annua]|uniref:Transmembrane receptor, eukaryota n=1 Tax=Artemisia annua TaxID=35608 RepID=A0A2U1K9Z9_ARTAN|nr:Transmembrane receptor, eukaryota [Artemisia annua]
MGFGVVRPTLGIVTLKVLLLGMIYCVALEALKLVENLGNINDFSGKARVFLVLPVCSIGFMLHSLDLFVIIYNSRKASVIPISPIPFLIARSMGKLELYRKLTNAFAVSVLVSVAWIGYDCTRSSNDQIINIKKLERPIVNALARLESDLFCSESDYAETWQMN